MVVLIEVLAILRLVAIVIWWFGLGRNPDDDGDAHQGLGISPHSLSFARH